MRGQTAKRARVAKSLDNRVERHRSASRSTRRRSSGKLNVRFPTPPQRGRTVLTATELWKAFGALDVFADVELRRRAGRAPARDGAQRRGQDHAAARCSPAGSSPTSARSSSARNVSLGYYAQEHEGIRPGRTLLDHMRDASDARRRRAARRCSACSALSGDEGVPGRGDAVGRREDEARARRSSSPAGTTCCCSTSRRTTSTRRRARATGDALASWPGTMIVVSHDVEFVRALAPDRVLLMPEGTLDYFDDEMLELVELA